MSKKIFSISLLFLVPVFVQAASCLEQGVTVVYVNGIFSNQEKARQDLDRLKVEYNSRASGSNITFLNGFNPSHLAGAGDLVKTWFQDHSEQDKYISDYDLKTILLKLHDDLETEKVLLLGHSQGSYYTNAMYEYLVLNGISKDSLDIYNVATPASFVAGKGKYLNSDHDSMLSFLRTTLGFKPLTSNVDFISSVEDALKDWPGHSLSSAYLAEVPDRVVGDMAKQISNLKATGGDGECFAPPNKNISYKLQKIGFAIGDPTALALHNGATAGYRGLLAAYRVAYYAVATAAGKVASAFSFELGTPEQDVATFEVFKALYGSSLERADVEALIKQQVKEQGAAVVNAAPAGLVLGAQTDVPSNTATTTKPKKYLNSAKHRSNNESPEENEQVASQPEVATTSEPALEPEEVEEEEEQAEAEVPEEEVATSTASSTPSQTLFTIASQEDESVLCHFRECYSAGDSERRIHLGKGSDLGDGGIYSITIAKDENSQYSTDKNLWIVYVYCYSESDYAYEKQCPDWVEGNAWTTNQRHLIGGWATSTPDGKHWTANFYDSVRQPNDTEAVYAYFRPEYYYEVVINDNGWDIDAYGSADEPYWVLTGVK